LSSPEILFPGEKQKSGDDNSLHASGTRSCLSSDRDFFALLGSQVAGVVHEMNTPLGVGMTAADHARQVVSGLSAAYRNGSLREGDFHSSMETLGESLDLVQSNLQRAVDFLNIFRRIASDKAVNEKLTVLPGHCLREIVESLKPRFRNRNIDVAISCPEDLTVYGNPGLLYQIAANLLINSLTHGFAGRDRGRIEMQVDRDDAGIRVIYRDDGAGIPSDIQDRIFEPFFTTRRDSGGTGLGLHTVRQAVAEMGGTIVYEPRPGGGVCFVMRFPEMAGSSAPGGEASHE